MNKIMESLRTEMQNEGSFIVGNNNDFYQSANMPPLFFLHDLLQV